MAKIHPALQAIKSGFLIFFVTVAVIILMALAIDNVFRYNPTLSPALVEKNLTLPGKVYPTNPQQP